MSKGAHNFRQSDLAKVIRTLRREGTGWRIEIAGGKIVLIGPTGPVADAGKPDAGEWD